MEPLVHATWDAEESEWVAQSDEVPGLITAGEGP
jgi:predicted RNase H-like HicB family nuclease